MDSRAGVERTSGIADAAGGHGPVLTVREAALRAGVNERTVRRAITDRRLNAEQVHGSYHIAPADFSAWMSARWAPAGTSARAPDKHPLAAVATDISDMVPAALFREERERVEDLHRQLHDTAALVGMLRGRLEVVESERDRLLAITAGEITREDAPQEDDPRPVRDAASVRASETPQDAQGLAWCRWWRRMTGGAVGLS
jgi:excisionase family DNA binding protein